MHRGGNSVCELLFFLTVNCQAPLSVNEENGSDSVLTLRSQTLTVSFKNPSNLLAENAVAAPSATSDSERNSRWWCLLEKARTYFDENPS
jgi:hypothetical protein